MLHDIRRTVRTRLSSLRVSERVAEMVIGHGKKGLARVYDQHEFRRRDARGAGAVGRAAALHRQSAARQCGQPTDGARVMLSVYTLETAPQAATPLSRDAVDRILESVGTVVPDDIDKDSLASDLDDVRALFQATEQKRSRKHRLAREKYAKGIREQADSLLKALDDQDHGYLL